MIRKSVFPGLCAGFFFFLAVTLYAEELVLYSTDEFQVDEYDLLMYLRNAPTETGNVYGSRARVLQALSDLYAIEILSRDAEATVNLSERDAVWIGEYAIKIEQVTAYIRDRVQLRMAETDWAAEAREHYLAHSSDFLIGEGVTLRTLLLKTDGRSQDEAIDLANELTSGASSQSDFESIVRQHTEDPVAAASGGLMTNVKRGQTVAPFEEVAFSLESPGQISDPVVSQFGVHVIQLIEKIPEAQLSYEEVEADIISLLKPKRKAQYRSAIQDEARERQPSGFVEHTSALDELVSKTTDGPLGMPDAAR